LSAIVPHTMSADIDILAVLPDNIFQTIFEKSPGSLLVKADSPNFTIVAVSDMYLQITSSARERIVGKGFFEVFPDDVSAADETAARFVFTRVIDTGKTIVVPTYRYDVFDFKTNNSKICYWSCVNTPIPGADKKVAYILNTVVEITGEVNAKEAAIESENKLRLAAEAAAFGTWELDLNGQGFKYSPRLAEIFGHSPDQPVLLARIRSQVHPDDMQNIVLKAFHESMVTGKYLYEVRIYWPDESLHWIKVQGVVIYDEKKKPISMLGTIIDITETRRDEIRKNDFIAMASHELKTPLTSLKAYIQLLSRKLGPSNDTFAANALLKANQQVNRMTDLIHGFLDLSKLEPGKLKLKMQPFDMSALAGDVIADAQLASPYRSIFLKAEGSIIVNADREKIRQVIGNFLSNAIKYSDKEGMVTVTCETQPGDVRVAVKDEGIGIRYKDQEKLFQRFYRVESDKMKNISGFGIGLYLSSEIIQRHRGTIGLESEENVGSTFYFTLPLPR